MPRHVLEDYCRDSGRCDAVLSTMERLDWHLTGHALLSVLWVLTKAGVDDVLNDAFFARPVFLGHAWRYDLLWRPGAASVAQKKYLKRHFNEVSAPWRCMSHCAASLSSHHLRPRPPSLPALS